MKPGPRTSSGFSLIVVLMLLLVVSVMGLAAAQSALIGERLVRNDRDVEVAFQAAEAALLDAQRDVLGPNAHATQRLCLFDPFDVSAFVAGCAGAGVQRGLCAVSPAGETPAWARPGFEFDDAHSVAYGTFTGKQFSGGGAAASARSPRYVVEALRMRGNAATGVMQSASAGKAPHVFRVTAVGFGPGERTRVLLQSTLAKPSSGASCAAPAVSINSVAPASSYWPRFAAEHRHA